MSVDTNRLPLPEPRVIAIPDRFNDAIQARSKDEVWEWSQDIYRGIKNNVSEEKLIERSVSVGWDADLASWLVQFTHAQNRPIRLVSEGHVRQMEATRNRNSYTTSLWTWVFLYFASFALAVTFLVLNSPLGILFLLANAGAGYMFFSTWADMKGHPATHGLWVLFPLMGIIVLALLPDRRRTPSP